MRVYQRAELPVRVIPYRWKGVHTTCAMRYKSESAVDIVLFVASTSAARAAVAGLGPWLCL
jgi:hypothetical protein